MSTTPTHEPLKPDPLWHHAQAGYLHFISNGLTHHALSPIDYAQGFEAGAYALANRLNEVIDDGSPGGMVHAMRILLAYRAGAAHPTKGWQHEPKRS